MCHCMGESGPPFPPSPASSPLPSPARPPSEEEARPAFAGEAGQAGAWPGPDPRSPALRLRPSAAASLRPRSLPPSFPVGPGADLGPPSRVSPSPPLPFPPALRSWLWGWARDVKPSVASARLAGAGHQKSNVLFPNYPLSVREQGRTGWELNVKYPLQAGSITPGIQPQPPMPLCQVQTTQRGLPHLLFFQGGGGGLSIPLQPGSWLTI